MNRYSIISCLLCAVLLFSFTACNSSSPAEEETVTTTTAPTTPTTAAIIDEVLTDMITKDEISAALGVEMTQPSLSGQGTVLTSTGVNDKVTLSIEVSEKPREIFDQMLLNYPILEPCPNLGEVAWYSPLYHQLLVYGYDFMITVEVLGLEAENTTEMLACRQIAALLLEHLAPAEDSGK